LEYKKGKIIMKKATVERVVVKNVCITFDGKEFDDFNDALDHEVHYLSSIDELKMFDGNGERVEHIDSTETVYFRTPRAAETFLMLNRVEGYEYDGLCEASLDWYFWEGDRWISPEEKLEKCKEDINKQLELCGGVPIG
jgi:hypothetical protein